MTNITTDLEAVIDALAKAAEGPWQADGYKGSASTQVWAPRGDESQFVCDAHDDNAAAVILAVNFLRNYGDAIREMQGEIERLREANGILEDGLQEVGDDYPGSSCQQWCQNMIANARAALNPKGEAQ